MKTYPITQTARLLGFILDAWRKGKHPSVRELSVMMGYKSSNWCVNQLKALKRDGMIDWEPGRARTVRPTCKWLPAEVLVP